MYGLVDGLEEVADRAQGEHRARVSGVFFACGAQGVANATQLTVGAVQSQGQQVPGLFAPGVVDHVGVQVDDDAARVAQGQTCAGQVLGGAQA